MTILRPGVVKGITDQEYVGVCEQCDCKISFSAHEAYFIKGDRSVVGNLCGNTVVKGPDTYQIKCPTSGCFATITALA